VSLFGDAQEIIRGLQEIREAGATLILLNPVFDELQHIELLAREVVTHV